MSAPLTCSVDAGVAHIELSRPQAANALDLPLARALRAAVARVETDDAVRAVLLTGAGKRFCAGGDVGSFVAATDPAAYLHELASEADAAVRALEALEKPVVAAVHGAVAGAGLGVMLACDLVVAADGTKLAFAYPGVGLTPDCGVSYLLPRAIGSHRALAFALGGRPIDATTACEWGMVTEVSDDAPARGLELARALAAGPALALGRTRRLLRTSWDFDRATVGATEADTISELVAGPEARTLVERFLGS
ncbi:enoyl-CoA hydratase/isomerase family protein [Nocardioides hwasunensis]|uniref:Enoyl-CoA hydratase/isomerase family protein n=1 Tax=Nocardioides hwasunensis TaxID=397258 RepID=A0ABR8MPQ9_9ACTN|nr:enoyl-CoA hydratase/isomerase family protein [Nocardioides hwasunensis]MBD3917031.1 enoyl-CoA hydratase/isomerase family protein [Nocardioides hwasunensis]